MALWGRLGHDSDDETNNISMELFEATMELWITGNADGGITGAEALAALALDGAEETEANRLKTAMNALASDAERRDAKQHIRAVMNFHEQQVAPILTGSDVEDSLVDWFASKGVTF